MSQPRLEPGRERRELPKGWRCLPWAPSGHGLPGGERGFLQHSQPGNRSVGAAAGLGRDLGTAQPLRCPPGQAEPPTRPGQAESGPRGVTRSFQQQVGAGGCL